MNYVELGDRETPENFLSISRARRWVHAFLPVLLGRLFSIYEASFFVGRSCTIAFTLAGYTR